MVKENAKGKNKSKRECGRHKYRHILEVITISFSGGVGQRKKWFADQQILGQVLMVINKYLCKPLPLLYLTTE
jgi:hypothetical protein